MWIDISNDASLNHFMPLAFLYFWKKQETSGFLIFLGDIERGQWHVHELIGRSKIVFIGINGRLFTQYIIEARTNSRKELKARNIQFTI